MNLISNVFVALLLTNISGTLFYLIAIIFRKIWFRKDIRLVRFSMIAVLCAYVVPLVYLVLWLNRRLDQNRQFVFNLFYNTPKTVELFERLGWLWIGLFLMLLARKLYRYRRVIMMCRGNIPEEDENIKRRFSEICAELGVEDKVTLCRNDIISNPCTTYYHGTVVILPLEKYTEREAEVIFYHELCHYLEKDMPLRVFGIVISLLHVFNPLIHIMLKQMRLVCEMSCDRLACEKAMHRFSENQYFQVIFNMLREDGERERFPLFSLVDDKSNYERRVAAMNEYRVSGGIKKSVALMLAAGFLLGSSFTSLAAGAGMNGAYEGYLDKTSEWDSEAEINNANHEAIMELARVYNINPEDIVIMDDVNLDSRGRAIPVEWNVRAGKTYVSVTFSENAGDQVEIYVVGDPADVTFWTGLQDPEFIMHYVEATDKVNHIFDIEMDGRYAFFVRNLSETEDLSIVATITK